MTGLETYTDTDRERHREREKHKDRHRDRHTEPTENHKESTFRFGVRPTLCKDIQAQREKQL